MNVQALLNQVLQSAGASLGGVADLARQPDAKKVAGGVAVGGVLGLLLGSRTGRNIGGKALKLGSVAAIGALAWKVYQDHQAKQQAAAPAVAAGAPSVAAAPSPGSFAALPAPQLENHSQAMLRAMIAAAKSDGHMDEHERQLVQQAMDKLQADDATRQWMQAELQRPVDPAAVAAAATTPELAAEIYLATLLVVDETTVMERAYLDELARQLKLAPGLKAELEARALAAA